MEMMGKVIGLFVGIAIFGVWMNLFANPQVWETAVGFVFAVGLGVLVWRKVAQIPVEEPKSKKKRGKRRAA